MSPAKEVVRKLAIADRTEGDSVQFLSGMLKKTSTLTSLEKEKARMGDAGESQGATRATTAGAKVGSKFASPRLRPAQLPQPAAIQSQISLPRAQRDEHVRRVGVMIASLDLGAGQ